MSSIDQLKRKYSFGPIPQWEIDALNEAQKPQKKRKAKDQSESETENGDGNGTGDTGA